MAIETVFRSKTADEADIYLAFEGTEPILVGQGNFIISKTRHITGSIKPNDGSDLVEFANIILDIQIGMDAIDPTGAELLTKIASLPEGRKISCRVELISHEKFRREIKHYKGQMSLTSVAATYKDRISSEETIRLDSLLLIGTHKCDERFQKFDLELG